jgi:DNA-binding HxlR family transcriptional regulator
MKKSQTIKEDKPICTELLKLIGDFWTLKIILALGKNKMRFCELERAIPNINAVTLTSRLKKMEKAGLVKRTTECDKRQPVIYTLTKPGIGIIPIAKKIEDYGNKFYS